MSEKAWQDRHWQSADGLTLHFRDYPAHASAPAGRPPILCIPGLTRNARDFEPVAQAFAGDWRVIGIDLRGRGASEYAKDSATYAPATYVADIMALLEQEKIGQVVAIGTSLGGLVSALLNVQFPGRLAGIVINDIGPEIEAEGLARIAEYVGQGRSFPTWMHAARSLRESALAAHPDFNITQWLRFAKRLMALGNGGRIAYDYDMRISEPFANEAEQPAADLWPLFGALDGVPALTLHGELSDILSVPTMQRMAKEITGMETLSIARTGHAPTLDEPEAQAAIARLLGKVATA